MTADRTPDREAAADAIDRFVAVVSSWIGWFKLIKFEESCFLAPEAPEPPPAAAALLHEFMVKLPPGAEAESVAYDRQRAAEQVFELTQKQNDEKVKVRDAGRALAADLEPLGIDSTPVLAMVHCTEAHGGGPGDVLPRWEEIKVALRRTAVRLRLPADPAPATPETIAPPSAPLSDEDAACGTRTASRRARPAGEVVGGIRSMLRLLTDAGLGVRRDVLLDALEKGLKGVEGGIEGAHLDTTRKDQRWLAPRESLLAWARARRGLTP